MDLQSATERQNLIRRRVSSSERVGIDTRNSRHRRSGREWSGSRKSATALVLNIISVYNLVNCTNAVAFKFQCRLICG